MYRIALLTETKTSAIAEVAEVALCASDCALPTSAAKLFNARRRPDSVEESRTGFEIIACPRQAEIASGKLFLGLTCGMGKLTKYSVLNNI